METTNFNIKGLTDNASANRLKNSVSALSGVSKVNVDLSGSKLMVTFNPDITDVLTIKNTVVGNGFDFK